MFKVYSIKNSVLETPLVQWVKLIKQRKMTIFVLHLGNVLRRWNTASSAPSLLHLLLPSPTSPFVRSSDEYSFPGNGFNLRVYLGYCIIQTVKAVRNTSFITIADLAWSFWTSSSCHRAGTSGTHWVGIQQWSFTG